jgi:hypothetical protein
VGITGLRRFRTTPTKNADLLPSQGPGKLPCSKGAGMVTRRLFQVRSIGGVTPNSRATPDGLAPAGQTEPERGYTMETAFVITIIALATLSLAAFSTQSLAPARSEKRK